MELSSKSIFYGPLLFMLFSMYIKDVSAVYCYECDSSFTMSCGETLADGHTIEPQDCMHLQEPLYCVKMTGVYEALCLFCYQCDSTKDYVCPERFTQIMIDAEEFFRAKSCDHVFEARYCIKTTGLFGGELGTKRFCSARDFGNYCEMVRRPGDERLYRACVYTCSDHYCNKARPTMQFNVFVTLFAMIFHFC